MVSMTTVGDIEAAAGLQPEVLQRCLDAAVSAAQAAGDLMLECFARNDAHAIVEEKANPTDLVTKYDRQVEDLVLARLRRSFPDFQVIGEETANGEALSDKPTWIVDPIDGTTNFVHRQAECCVLIGLAVERKSVLGVCFIPKLDEMYTAIKGRGAYCNGRRVVASGCEDLGQAMVNTHFTSYSRHPRVVDRLLAIMRDLMMHPTRAMRAGGSTGVDMMHVARGRLDAYFEVGVYPWDVCAGIIIVTEAGGVCVDTLGGPLDLSSRRILVASTPALAKQIATYLATHNFASLDAEPSTHEEEHVAKRPKH
jgi:fructose-1,6-bisphosphatase/inositol monophosphatase family enzyme